jgi:DNA-directed RNA polymerase subunit RPC12/RpoP
MNIENAQAGQCPEERAGKACILDEGHAANHNNGVTSWGYANALEGAACSGCGSDLIAAGAGYRCAACGQDTAVLAAVPCECGHQIVIVRSTTYRCPSCAREAPREAP